MLRSKTVFVVGAGASREYGLPVGGELKRDISNALKMSFERGRDLASGSLRVFQGMHEHCRTLTPPSKDVNSFVQSGLQIAAAMPQAISIDNYLYAHQSNNGVNVAGKLAITDCILTAERNSTLYSTPGTPSFNFGPILDTWLVKLQMKLFEDVNTETVDTVLDNCSFIIFNYDRCVEYFLVSAIMIYFGVGMVKATKIVNSANIIHPYGTVGNLPWQFQSRVCDFGDTECRIYDIAVGVRTFTERLQESETLDKINSTLCEAQRVVFLGFSFARQNMELLTVRRPEPGSKPIEVFFTRFGLSNFVTDQITTDLYRVLGTNPPSPMRTVPGMTCAGFFDEFGAGL